MTRTHHLARLPLATALALAVGHAQAATENPAAPTLETIVVVGQTTNSEVTPVELINYQANDLADIFRQVPSVNVGGSLGIAQKVYIRGLEDTLFNVTVDGAPQTGTLFHHVGRVFVEPELLKQVEVQAGAGEATSGAGAIGGAIRFRTKSADDLLADGESFGGSLKAGVFSNEGQRGSATLYGRLGEDWGLLGSWVQVNRKNMTDGDGEELFGTGGDQTLGFAKFGGQLTDSQHLSISLEHRKESGDFGQRPNWPALENDPLYPMDGERTTVVLNHQWLASDLVQLETTLYNTDSALEQDVYNRWGKYGADIGSYGFDIRNTSQLADHRVTYGVEYRKDRVESEYLSDPSVWADWAWDPAVGKFKEEGSVAGVYLQDHWQLNPDLLLSFGGRYDAYDLKQTTYGDSTDSAGFSPNVGLQYQISSWQLDLGYAQALRGKEVGDAFTLEQAPDDQTLAPDLKAETVDNLELGVTYTGDDLRLVASVYQSDIHDVIYDQIGQGVYFENVGTLKTSGYELRADYTLGNFQLGASYGANDAELNGNTVEGYEHIGLANARGDTFNLNLSYSVSEHLEFGWNFNWVQDLNNIEVLQRAVELGWIDSTQTIDKPGYQVHDIYLMWQPLSSDALTLNLAVINLFDEHYRDHSSVGDYNSVPGWEGVAGLYEAGRDIRASVNFNF